MPPTRTANLASFDEAEPYEVGFESLSFHLSIFGLLSELIHNFGKTVFLSAKSLETILTVFAANTILSYPRAFFQGYWCDCGKERFGHCVGFGTHEHETHLRSGRMEQLGAHQEKQCGT